MLSHLCLFCQITFAFALNLNYCMISMKNESNQLSNSLTPNESVQFYRGYAAKNAADLLHETTSRSTTTTWTRSKPGKASPRSLLCKIMTLEARNHQDINSHKLIQTGQGLPWFRSAR